MTEKTMTTREFLVAVCDMIDGSDDKEIDVLAIRDKAHELIETLDKRNEKRKSTESKEKKEAAARRDLVLGFLREHEGAFTREVIADAICIKPTEVTGACTILVREGLIKAEDVKIDKTRRKAYSLA